MHKARLTLQPVITCLSASSPNHRYDAAKM